MGNNYVHGSQPAHPVLGPEYVKVNILLMLLLGQDVAPFLMQFKSGKLPAAEYEAQVNDYMRYAIEQQELLGLDVLVHGEPERTDM